MENKENFTFTYSAAQQQEIESIRKKYLPPEEDKMAQLRRLHQIPTQKAQVWSLVVGILGVLLLGTGMSLAMTELGTALGIQGHWAMILGIVIGLGGMALAALAYPVYNRILRRERARIAPEILRLTDELLR